MLNQFPPSSSRRIAYLLLTATAMLWGATFVLVKDALADVSPLLFNLLRMSVAFAVLLVINRRQMLKLPRRTLISGAIVGVLLAAGYQLQTSGLAGTTPAKSAFITGLVVVFVPMLMTFPRLRPAGSAAPRWTALVGAALALAGLFLLTTPPGTRAGEIFAAIGAGDWLTLGCALAFAGHLLALGRYSPGIPAASLATLQIGVAAVVMLVTLPLGGTPHLVLTSRLVVALGVTSVLATAAAFTVQSWAQQHLPATHTSLILALEPVFAWLTALVFLDESLGRRSVAGAGLILCAIAVTEMTGNAPVEVVPA